MNNLKIPDFGTKKELFEFLVTNKQILLAQKKATLKEGDACLYFGNSNYKTVNKTTYKANEPIQNPGDSIKVVAIINTTNFMDSHYDVHLPGIWNKSIKENKMPMHLQEHQMRFDKIIAEGNDLEVSVKTYKWSELGYAYNGSTQVLVFNSNVRKDRNSFMFDQYAKGYVKNHSVTMQYVKLVMAINDNEYGAEFEAWEKYFPEIVNKERAEEVGYFWAVKEAKFIEGSAVPIGSNTATPTLENNKQEPGLNSTLEQIEPGINSTQKVNYKFLNNHFKF